MRRVTLITLIVLFLALVGAAVYQVTLGGGEDRLCGPPSPGALPSPGACPSPSPTP